MSRENFRFGLLPKVFQIHDETWVFIKFSAKCSLKQILFWMSHNNASLGLSILRFSSLSFYRSNCLLTNNRFYSFNYFSFLQLKKRCLALKKPRTFWNFSVKYTWETCLSLSTCVCQTLLFIWTMKFPLALYYIQKTRRRAKRTSAIKRKQNNHPNKRKTHYLFYDLWSTLWINPSNLRNDSLPVERLFAPSVTPEWFGAC